MEGFTAPAVMSYRTLAMFVQELPEVIAGLKQWFAEGFGELFCETLKCKVLRGNEEEVRRK